MYIYEIKYYPKGLQVKRSSPLFTDWVEGGDMNLAIAYANSKCEHTEMRFTISAHAITNEDEMKQFVSQK